MEPALLLPWNDFPVLDRHRIEALISSICVLELTRTHKNRLDNVASLPARYHVKHTSYLYEYL